MEAHNYVRNFEITMRRQDGTILLAVESSFATRDANGNIERYQGFVLDTTEKRRAEDEMRRRNRELNALNAMAVVAAQSFDLDEILNLTLRQVVTLFGAESGSVYLSDTDTPTFRRRAAWGPRTRDKNQVVAIASEQLGEFISNAAGCSGNDDGGHGDIVVGFCRPGRPRPGLRAKCATVHRW